MVPRQSKSLFVCLCVFFASVLLLPGHSSAQSGNVIVATSTTWATGTYNVTSLTVENGAVLTIGGGSTLTATGAITVTASSSIVLQSINNAAQVNGTWQGVGVTLNAASVEVDSGSSINADGQGYVASAGPGGGTPGTSAGGSYGGIGGVGSGAAPLGVYGSSTVPTALGSGGGVRCCSAGAGAGGGAVLLTVSGLLTNNGTISANGGNATNQAGGGAGGSVYVTTGTLSGAGFFEANGGNNGEGSGGGGRVAVYYNASSGNFSGFAGSTTSGGTCGGGCTNGTSSNGSVGTAAFFDTSATNDNLAIYQNFTLPASSTISYNSINVTAGALLTIGGGTTLNIATALTVTGTVVAQSVNNSAQVNGTWAGSGVSIRAASITVASTGSLNADAQGYVQGAGPGGAPSGTSSGGSYGGLGGSGLGAAVTPVYGSTTNPTDLGSGGNTRCCSTTGGSGGGALTLTVSGTLTDNGVISANGGPVAGLQAGGGAGGTVLVQTTTLAGSGVITSTGGSGNGEAAGGGGRIALYYTTNTSFNLNSVTADGGATTNGTAGAVGTVYSLSGGSSLTVSNNTVLPANSNLTFTSVTVNNQATLTLGSGTTLNSGSITVTAAGTLTVGGGSTLNVTGAVLVTGKSNMVLQSINNSAQVNGTWQGTGVTLNAASVQVDSGSTINADGQGYTPNAGPGGAPSGSSAGGSYGGIGGLGIGGSAAATYGSTTAPTDLGSGGSVRCCSTTAGNGGGAIRMLVSGVLTNNGVISANGGTVVGLQAGAGAAGSVYVTTNGLVGAGIFSAVGGTGGEAAGGGGRIAVYYNATASSFTGFSGSTSAGGVCGNNCSNGTSSAGSVGTSAFYDTSATNNNLSVYQDQIIPAGSVLTYNSITVQAGALLTIGGGSTITVTNALTVNGTVVAQSINNTAQINNAWAGQGVTINAASIVVPSGGSLNTDGQGYVGGAGPGAIAGAGNNGSSAGGSYGGQGGIGDGASAGPIYGSTTAPTDLGSGGASRCCSVVAGAGGGDLRLIVSGTITNNGIISSNGGPVVGLQGGGGSGGAVYVTTSALMGAGAFTANGGVGGEAGGGGGRVAVYYNATVSQFTGYIASTASAGGCANDCSNGTSSAGSNGTSAFYDTSATNGNLMVYQDQTIPAGSVVNYNSITVETGSVLTIGGGSTINVAGSFTVSGTVVAQSINNTAQINGTWLGSGVAINAASLVINTGSSLNADGQGYVAGAGPGAIAGAGNNGSSAGGSYGGLGGVGDGAAAAAVYGSSTKPTDLGSGGASRCCSAGAGAGGGGLTLTISGTLTNNGIISANGAAVVGLQAGGGSGGAVLVTTNGLSGSGVFEANGGLGGEAGGGGGRVALYYNGPASNFTGFAGSTASGGGCGNNCTNGTSSAGSNGTAAFFDTSVTNNNLSVYQNFTIPASSAVNYNNITVQNGALITIGGGASVTVANTLSVSGTVVAQAINNTALVNGVWVGSGVTLNAATLQVAATGSINADAQGYVASAGPGAIAGAGNNGSSAGGSYGGVGGTGDGFAAAPTYGSPTAPTDLGSGGTARCCGVAPGAGGGAIAINVSGTLTDNGIISSNGGAVNGLQGGGGSGGSLNIHTGIIAGSGTIAANGGSGNGEAGGAGGRVALYFNTNSGFNLVSATASGAATTNGNPGGAGTVYTLGAGTNLTVAQNAVLPANATLTYSTVTINNGGTFTLGTGTSLTAGSINVAAAGTFTVGGGSTVTDTGALVVTGNSNVVLQSQNNSGPVNGSYVGVGVTVVAASVEVDAGSTINADGQGYLAGTGPGAGPSGSSDGGSYGGLGGNGSGVPPAATYGSATTPTALGSGGSSRCCSAPPGAGGGAMRLIVGGTLTDNGVISANGGAATNQAGGGSGGSLFLVTNTIAGTGAIQANGGAGGEGSGGGGRVAVYYLTNTNFPVGSVLAAGGTAGVAGANGTVELINAPTSVFLLPTQPVLHGTSVTVQYFTNVGGPSTVTLGGPQTATIASGTTGLTTATFDTTQFPDGSYQLILTALNNAGQAQQPVVQSAVINNSVAWHSGTLTTSQTWSGPQVQALDGQVIVPAGVILTITPGTIVKALPGAEIVVQSGGTLIANGTSTAQVIFTTFDDYTVGGDTDFNQGISVPSPGEWNGVAVLSGGTFTDNTYTILRYVASTLAGSLTGSTTLYSTQVYSISGTLVVPSGVTLTIQPGAILKLGPGAGIDVQPGATMVANGTLSQPIYFTSYNDISIGGDTNNTGGSIAPAPGDWNSIILDGATVSMQHVQMQYGGGPLNSGAQAGMLETTDNANVSISDSVFAYSFFIGIQTGYPNGGGDTVTVTDSVFYGIEDRAINAYPGSTVHVVNDTFDGNAYGVFAHGGVVDMENSVVSNSIGTQFGAVEACCGSTFVNLSNNDVYNPAKGVTNYTGVTDPTGTLGNISANPVYMNQLLHDYRPTYGSPLIDAANGTVANYPLTDSFGLTRYNAPLVTHKTGTPDVNGNYPDMGAFEFVQTAPSNLDFTVSDVNGPAAATVGTQVQVTWTVTNIGSGTAYGPWHDAVYLVTDPGTNTVETLAGTALEGAGIVLGPGATYNATATITVPGVTVGLHRWEVKTNVLGEIFEGANTANNTGIALNEVTTDLTQLTAGATPLSGSFSGIGQSTYYKVVPSATQTTQVQLALNGGNTGSVQLFVGAGYVPSPQRYDFQQSQFDSSTATVIIPSGSTQTYYITAYAQALTSVPATFTIQASTLSFSLTSVTPGNVVNSGSATLTFVGGGFTNSTTFALVAANGTTYTGAATFLADSAHADVTFNVGTIPAGKYSAEAINGSSVTLANAVTLSTGVAAVNATNPTVQVTLDTPQAFRAGFPSIITLHYTNISPDDIPAPLIYVAAGNATLSEIAPPCSTCSANYQQQYAATFNSGLVLGINQQGPAGVLPSGASGSIQFMATPSSSGTASFYASPDAVDPLAVQLTLAQNLCYQTTGIVEVVCYYNATQVGAYASAANLCATFTPLGADTEGQQRACMALLNNAGYSFQNLPTTGTFFLGPQSEWNQYAGGHVTAANFNALLAADATALSKTGIYTYDVQSLLGYELQKDGMAQLVPRYHQGAFGFGASHPFDIKLNANTVTYPDGTVRNFPIVSPTQANVFLGLLGDYGTLTLEGDGSYLLTEPSGVLLHFLGSTDPLDYIQDRDGNRITMAYTNNLLTSATDNFGNKIAFTYDSLGHITQYTDFAGRTTTFTYDILPDTQHSTFLRSVSNSGGTTSITWNEGDSYGVGYFADSCVATYCEPAIGITSMTYPDGSQANYTYDAVGRITSLSRNSGAQSVSFTYNNDGSITSTDNLGKSTQFTLNQGAEIASITDPLGNLTRLRYDGEGKAINVVGALGDSIFGTYDSLGNLNSVTSARGSLASLSFTGDQSPTSLTDPDGNASSFSYDGSYDLTAYAYPNGSKTTYTYNAQGQPLTVTNRRGNTITFTYTTQGLLASKTYANNSQVLYSYDGHQNLTSVSAPIGTTKFTYDSADRPLSQTNPDGASLQFTYNANGQRASMTDSTGFVTNYTYDAVGRLTGLTNSTGASIVTYGYDADGQLISKTLGNGTSTSYVRDADGNSTSVINYSATKAVLSEYDYTFDGEGNPLTMKAPNGNYSYTYDLDGQLTSVTTPTGTIQYAYDASGNRTSVTTNGVAATYEPNNLNEYQVANNVAYQYDADGNLISGNGYTYTYDDEGKLLTMVSSTDNWSFQYDGLNNRVASVHNGATIHYLIDLAGFGDGNLEAEFSGTGALVAHYTYGLGLTSNIPAGGTANYYHFDGTGNTAQITNSTGTVVNSYTYLPFGEQTVLASGITNPFTYNGQNGALDDGSGLYFMRNRTYDSAIGRFHRQDPLGLESDLNLYRYVNNSPVEYSDPTGLTALDDFTQATSDSAGAHALNATSGFANNSGLSGVASGVGAIGSIASAAQNAANGNTSYAVHDVTLAFLGVISNILPPEPPPGPAGVLYYVVKYAGTIDEVSQNYFNLQQQAYQNSIYTSPFAKDPQSVCGPCLTHKTPPVMTPIDSSIDPNGKLTSGYGNNAYVPAGQPIVYTIFFENQSSATLPAQKVTVTDSLPSNLDWSTVQFDNISFNNVSIATPTTTQTYTTQATVSTDSNPVAVSAAVNPATGILTFTMQSVDPTTGGAPANPLAGFLPPNNAANAGIGSVTFSVVPKSGLANGALITNQASIVFDVNAPIVTNTVSNTLDTSTVTSAISPLPSSTTSPYINVSWSGSDASGSGIAYYNIYVSIDSGAYALWLSATTLTTSTYTAITGHTYTFYSTATNNVGIQQITPGAPQTITVTQAVPTVTVTPAASSISTTQSLSVGIAVASPTTGGAVPTGTVTLSSGSYTSAATTLASGSASITIPAGALAAGTDTLTAVYLPDTASQAFYTGNSGTAQVTVGTSGTTAPVASLSPSTLAFTSVSGATSAAQTVQLSNTGNAALTISGITITGAGAAAFAQTSNCGTTLAAGFSCNISITFTPSAAGSFSASLAVADNASGSPQTVTLNGTGTAAPAPIASVTPTSLTFTSTNGTASAAQTATLSNTGNAALSISGISLTGAGAAAFTQTNTCGASVAAGAKCTISVTFTPSSVTSFSATLSIADNASGSPQTITLTGAGTAAPTPVTITPASLTFTSANGTSSAAQIATLSNTGSAAITISGISLTGAGAAAFAQTNTCGTSLAAGANCTISITFTPSSVASFSATLSIADSASGSPQTVALTGTGTAAAAPVAAVTPTSLTFTSTSGTASAAQTATLSNTGNAALTLSGITITGAGAAAFAQTSTCGTSLAAGANCSISITFTPSSVASFSATLSIADNASNSPQTVSLSGTGAAAAAPVASVTPTSLTFTSTNGTASAAQIATLSNTGSAALSISGITLTGAGAATFAQTNTCGTSLAAGAKCSISLTFTPSSVASFSATLSIADNASGSPQTVSLAGTGTAAPAPAAAVTPSSLTFTSPTGTASAAQVATLSNTGSAALSISGITLGGSGAAVFAQSNTCGSSLAAGANCTISITFTPSAAASYSATLSIADNASGSPQAVSLTGTGTTPAAPIASVTPSTLTFTSFVGASSAAQVAQLSNTGNAALTIGGITLTGTGAASFAQTNTCGASLAAGASCNISVNFTPSAAAAFTATLSIADNASGSPQTVTLTGTGSIAPVPVVSITPATLAFTSTVGIVSAAQTAQLSNTGNAALTITGISLTGTGNAAFAQTNTCGTSLAAGATCTISVIFTPVSAGSFSASVSIADNAGGSPQAVALTGTGVAGPSFQLSATPSSQSVRYGLGTTYTINVIPQNGAFTSPVTLTATGLPAVATGAFSPVTVTPGSSTVSSTFTVQTIYPLAGLRNLDGSSTRPLLAFIGMLFLVTRKRRQLRLLSLLLVLSLAGLASLTGCGSSPSNANYTITITGTGGTQVQTTTVTLSLHE